MNITISERLKYIASFVDEGCLLCDIGTDHAYIPIYLLLSGKINNAIAADVNKGPLEIADKHCKEYGLSDKISLRLSDGLEKISANEADNVIIAGMGGELITGILSRKLDAARAAKKLILSPHSKHDALRSFLSSEGFKILNEGMISEEDKFYPVIVCKYTGEKVTLSEEEAFYGPELIKSKNSCLKSYLSLQKQQHLERLKKVQGSIKGLKAVEDRLDLINRTLNLLN